MIFIIDSNYIYVVTAHSYMILIHLSLKNMYKLSFVTHTHTHLSLSMSLYIYNIITPGLMESERGAGVMFGPDVAQTFMDTNNLSMIIRSHEMVKKGFLLNYSNCVIPNLNPVDSPLLATIFSASNYSDGDNEGMYIRFLLIFGSSCYLLICYIDIVI